MRQPFYITTSIPYVNAPPHIGFALELVYTDAMARYQRLLGKDVAFVTGTDEHGTKIARKAKENGVTPQRFTDETSALFRDLCTKLNASITDFYRTTESRHVTPVEEFWRRAMASGYIYKKLYGGRYCIGCEAFKPEKDLVDGMCPDHHTVPEYIEEENYFFALSAFRERLLALYAERPDFVLPPSKFNEMKQLVDGGLEDISISRSKLQLEWGLSVPDDPSQVIYVWFDALINYVSAIGFGTDPERFERFWPTVTHVIGKDINRFHTALWPAMCMAAGIAPPQKVAVHGWIHVEGQKMSKSLGNVIVPEDLIDLYGVDATRYLLLSQVPFTGDGDWNDERSRQRYAADLANTLGNLVFRVTNMLKKYFDGTVPARIDGDMTGIWAVYRPQMETFRFDLAIETILAAATEFNKEIDTAKPWTLAKEGKTDELGALLYRWLEGIRQIAWMLRPIMPEASDRILDTVRDRTDRDAAVIDEVAQWGGLEPGAMIEPGEPLFPRIDASSE